MALRRHQVWKGAVTKAEHVIRDKDGTSMLTCRNGLRQGKPRMNVGNSQGKKNRNSGQISWRGLSRELTFVDLGYCEFEFWDLTELSWNPGCATTKASDTGRLFSQMAMGLTSLFLSSLHWYHHLLNEAYPDHFFPPPTYLQHFQPPFLCSTSIFP